ncbi:MAG: STAS domain-containing protein [Nitriliruptor sp.]|nr:MAG: STAS domain-containing protein [Nitriliruptor sp.]
MTDPANQPPRDHDHAAEGHRLAGSVAVLRRLPLLRWLQRTDAGSRRADLLAGLTVAAMLVPQGMAYAALAGMPPVTGLYASTVPLVAYALLGTSGQLAFGPVAIVSLLTASTLAPVAQGDPGLYITAAALLALLVGAIQIALGIAHAGRLTSLLSHPVISGFTSAAAIVIATSQLDKLFGIDVGSPASWVERVGALLAGLDATHVPTLLVGLLAIAALVGGRRLGSKVPTALLVVVLATAAVPLFDLEARGIAVLGEVPRGLPLPSLPLAPLELVVALLPGALIIALLSYLEGISVARAIAARTRDRIDPDQELLASGAANLAAGVFQAFPVAGGFSRTAINHSAGARTPLASLVSAGGVVLALLLFAPLLATLPEVVLAAVVLVAVAKLVDAREAVHSWQVERTDGAALVVTFLATLLLGVELGIGVGIAVSLVLSLWRVGIPAIEVEPDGHGSVLHVEGDLLPASAVVLQEAVEDHLAARGSDPEEEHLILDLSGVPSADVSGINALAAAVNACDAADVELHLAGLREGVRRPLERAHLCTRLVGRVHADVPAALAAVGAAGVDAAAPTADAACRLGAPAGP